MTISSWQDFKVTGQSAYYIYGNHIQLSFEHTNVFEIII